MAHLDRCALPGTVGGGQSSGRARTGSFRLGFGAGRSGYTRPARRRILPLRAAGFFTLGRSSRLCSSRRRPPTPSRQCPAGHIAHRISTVSSWIVHTDNLHWGLGEPSRRRMMACVGGLRVPRLARSKRPSSTIFGARGGRVFMKRFDPPLNFVPFVPKHDSRGYSGRFLL
jgi:hypothetical protein